MWWYLQAWLRKPRNNAPQPSADGSGQEQSRRHKTPESTVDLQMVLKMIDAFLEQRQAHHEESKTSEIRGKRIARGTLITTIWAAAFALVAACGAVMSAIYTRNQVRDSERQEVRQIRAYMFENFRGIKIERFPVPKDGSFVTGQIFFKNGGETPAYNSKLVSWFGVYDNFNESSIPFAKALVEPPIIVSSNYAYKDAWISQNVKSRFPVSLQDAALIMHGETKRIVFFGDLTWSDVFRKEHWLHFCLIAGGQVDFPTDAPTPINIDRCPYYNETDESD